MNVTDLRKVLEEERDSLAAEMAVLTEVPRDPMTAVSFGKRIGDGTTEAIERINRVGVAEKLHAKAKDVARALAKMDEGSYGECDNCGLAIPAERLEAMPWASLCVECSASRA